MLECENLQVHYGRVQAVRGVSLTVGKGEMVCVVGPNGAGKSTTLFTIAGAQAPASGTIKLNGQSITGVSPDDVARAGLSLVPEGRHVFTRLSVEENLRLGTTVRNDREKIEEDFESMLTRFPFLRERLGTPGGKLSGGEQQQLVIARALMTRPSIILIDEPSLGLAPMMVDTVYDVLNTLREQGITLLVVEQSTHRALENADRIYVLRNGSIQLERNAKDASDEEIEQAYFGFETAPEKDVVHF